MKIVCLALLLATAGSAWGLSGTWAILSTKGSNLGQVNKAFEVATDSSNNLYIVENYPNYRIQKRDVNGDWSILATFPQIPSLEYSIESLAVDNLGNIFITESGETYINNGSITESNPYSEILEYDLKGSWIEIIKYDLTMQFNNELYGITEDDVGDLFADDILGKVLKRDSKGKWASIPLPSVTDGHINFPVGIALDKNGEIYVSETQDKTHNGINRIEKIDLSGKWTILASECDDFNNCAPGEVIDTLGIATDKYFNVYVSDLSNGGEIQKCDANGNWTIFSTNGTNIGQVGGPSGLSIDTYGNLFVADGENNRIEEYILIHSGDMNNDGKVTLADAILALQVVTGTLTPTPAQLQAGDLAGTGEITIADVIKILEYAVGAITQL